MGPKISIITAIHNSLAMNRLFWKSLSENTTSPFELILIDNHSTDGSAEFFTGLRDPRIRHVRNEFNQLYPASQNQGVRFAKTDILCFLNNDIWVPRCWNSVFEEKLNTNPLLVLSPSGQEAQPTQSLSDRLKRKWRRCQQMSILWRKVFRKSEEERLWKSLKWMYGSLEKFSSPTPQSEKETMPGIKGDSVVFHRKLLERFPEIWDESVEAADWNLYLFMASQHEKDPSIPLPQVLLRTYIHHFGRYTAHKKNEIMRETSRIRGIEEIWGKETVDRLWWGNRLPA